MRNILRGLATGLLVLALTACSGAAVGTTSVSDSQTSDLITSAVTGTGATVAVDSGAATAAEALAENAVAQADPADLIWDSAAVSAISLNGDSITADAAGVQVDGSRATLTAAGTYSLSGALTDGQIVVDTADDGVVQLILNGVDIHNETGAAISIVNAEKVVIVLADGTQNALSDGASYVFADPAETEPNAALFSKSDLTIAGNGALTVTGNYNDGIASKDGLLIAGGTLTVTAADDGLRGKDYLIVTGGALTVTAQGDGLKADNEEDATAGYIAIEAGTVTVTAGGDTLTAQTDVLITGGTFNLTAGGGSRQVVAADASAKGLKAVAALTIDGGTFTINAADDALHSNGSLTINGGVFQIATGDDGAHADATLTVNGGELQITESYEGLESAVLTLNAGTIHIVASDDGLNVASGNDGSGTTQGAGVRPGRGPGQDAFAASASASSYRLVVNGGYVTVDAAGDGLDINGAIEMSGGVVIVNGPTEQMNGALDYDGSFPITGGFLVTAGSAGMAMAPDSSSSQASVLVNLTSTLPAGTLFQVVNSAGETILAFAPSKPYQSVTFSSPALVQGETYTIYLGGTATGTVVDGLYQAGSYSGGSQYASFTVASAVTQLGGGGGGRFRP